MVAADPFPVNLGKLLEREFAGRNVPRTLRALALVLLEIGQPEFGYAEHVGLEAPFDELALNPQAGIVSPRWQVADQIGKRRFRPRRGFLGLGLRVLACLHQASIKSKWYSVENGVVASFKIPCSSSICARSSVG